MNNEHYIELTVFITAIGFLSCWNSTKKTNQHDADTEDNMEHEDFDDVIEEDDNILDVACDTADSGRDYDEWSECEVIGDECTPDDLVYYPSMLRDENGERCWFAFCTGLCKCGFIEREMYPCDPPMACDICNTSLGCTQGLRILCKGFDESGEQFEIKEGCCNHLGQACCHLDPAPCTNQCME